MPTSINNTSKDLSKEEKAASWEIADIVIAQGESSILDEEEEERVLRLCQQYPTLVTRYFYTNQGTRAIPFEFLIAYRASLETIKSFLEFCPSAVETKNSLQFYPLHLACITTNTKPGIIPYIVKKHPLVATKKTLDGKSPIELILKRDNTLEDVRALLEADTPAESLRKQDRLLSLGLASHSREDVLEHIVEQCPLIKSFNVSRFGGGVFHYGHAMALAKLLPQLKRFDLGFTCRQIDLKGWAQLMQSLGNCSSLDVLRLYVSSSQWDESHSRDRVATGAALTVPLNDALSAICNLKRLRLDGHHIDSSNITDGLVSLLGRNCLQFLRVTGFRLDHEPVFAALSNNTSLQDFDVVACVNNDAKRKLLSEVMAVNTSLLYVSLSSTGGEAVVYEKIRYLLRLNQLGRLKARDHSTTPKELVSLLTAATQSFEATHPGNLEQATLMFGLMRECPSIWCGNY